nr:T9SS type A sorting domain-containing protein [Bacteroidota bacterium]
YKVIDEAGGTIFHLPFPPPNGQWSNTIGNFKSGEGYYVRVIGDAVFTLDEPRSGTPLVPQERSKPETTYFQPVWNNNPYMPMHIMLQPDEALQPGDEIGIFDGDVCVGATTFDGDLNNPIIITTSMDDPETDVIDGFIQNNPVDIKFWQNGCQNSNWHLTSKHFIGDKHFTEMGTYVGQVKFQASSITDNYGNIQVMVFPNPVKDNLHLKTISPIPLEWVLIDTQGNELMKGSTIKNPVIDVSFLLTGVYFIKIKTTQFVRSLMFIKQ